MLQLYALFRNLGSLKHRSLVMSEEHQIKISTFSERFWRKQKLISGEPTRSSTLGLLLLFVQTPKFVPC